MHKYTISGSLVRGPVAVAAGRPARRSPVNNGPRTRRCGARSPLLEQWADCVQSWVICALGWSWGLQSSCEHDFSRAGTGPRSLV